MIFVEVWTSLMVLDISATSPSLLMADQIQLDEIK